MNKGSASQLKEERVTSTQRFLHRPHPDVIGGVVERDGFLDGAFSSGSTHAATLSSEYVKYLTRKARLKYSNPVRERWQKATGKIYVQRTERYSLWTFREIGGWTVHRVPRGEGVRQMLTTLLGDTPILCSSFAVAAKLAEESSPNPPLMLHWL